MRHKTINNHFDMVQGLAILNNACETLYRADILLARDDDCKQKWLDKLDQLFGEADDLSIEISDWLEDQ